MIQMFVGLAINSIQPAAIISLEPALNAAGAHRVLADTEALADANNAPSAIAVTDPSGLLLAFIRMDGARPGSIDLAIGKAHAAALMRRPMAELEQNVAGGRIALATGGLTALRGGVPIMVHGVCVGAVGIAGLNKDEDATIAAKIADQIAQVADAHP